MLTVFFQRQPPLATENAPTGVGIEVEGLLCQTKCKKKKVFGLTKVVLYTLCRSVPNPQKENNSLRKCKCLLEQSTVQFWCKLICFPLGVLVIFQYEVHVGFYSGQAALV